MEHSPKIVASEEKAIIITIIITIVFIIIMTTMLHRHEVRARTGIQKMGKQAVLQLTWHWNHQGQRCHHLLLFHSLSVGGEVTG